MTRKRQPRRGCTEKGAQEEGPWGAEDSKLGLCEKGNKCGRRWRETEKGEEDPSARFGSNTIPDLHSTPLPLNFVLKLNSGGSPE